MKVKQQKTKLRRKKRDNEIVELVIENDERDRARASAMSLR
jgi:hypothetical protein